MLDDRNRYWPRQIDELEGTPVTLINEPLPPHEAAPLCQTALAKVLLI